MSAELSHPICCQLDLRLYQEGNIMTMRASQNGTGAAEMEFETAHYSNPELEEEWELHEGHPYSNPEMEDEADRFIPIIAKAATRLLPKAISVGRNLIRGMRQRPGSRRRVGGRNQQIASLFQQLGRIFAQGEYEAAV